MRKNTFEKSFEDLTDVSVNEDTKGFTRRYFTIKINDKNLTSIEKTIKSKRGQIYDLLKKKLLKSRDFIISRNNKINPFMNHTERTKRIKKEIKLSQLNQKIKFGSLDYLTKILYQDTSKNKSKIMLNRKSLLNSRHFNFAIGAFDSFPKLKKNFFSQEKEKDKKENNYNKTAIGLGIHRIKKNENENTSNNNKEKEKEEISNNYINTEPSNILGDTNENNNNNLFIKKKYSKEFFINSELTTPRNKNFFDNKIRKDMGFSSSKNNLISPKDMNSSQHSFYDNFLHIDEKKANTANKKEKKEIKKIYTVSEKSQLNKLLINYLNNNKKKIEKRKANSNKNKSLNFKYNYSYRKALFPINDEKLLKNFQKYADLLDKENELHNLNANDIMDTEQNNKNVFQINKKLEKEKMIKKKFCEFGSKSISSLMTGINSDQIALNNKLFKIIDKTNKKVKKEKQLDKVLEIILDKKIKKKKRIKAKQIYIDAMDGKKLLEERDKLRFMMRFADLIKNMKDEIALNYTKNILDTNTKLQNEFNIPELAEYRRLKKEKHLKKQNLIRNRLKSKNDEIEMKIKINQIEKDFLYHRYENIFKRNKILNQEKQYKNNQTTKNEQNYHNIDNILCDFDKILSENE